MDNIKNLNDFMNMSMIYKEKKDYDNALKYAALATISTKYPRADACCQMGDIYLSINNLQWAELWFKAAIGNVQIDINGNTIDESFSTWIPMLKLSYVYYMMEDIDKAKAMNDAVLLIQPQNADALANKEIFNTL